MTTEYTDNIRLNLPDFRMGPWHDLVNDDFVMIDEHLQSLYQGVDTSPWLNSHLYSPGTTAIDSTDHSYWVCITSHTSAAVPITFASDRSSHPTYWNRVVVGVSPRGPWAHDTHYLVNDMVTDAVQGIIAVCTVEHTSNHSGTIRDDSANWSFIADITGGVAFRASSVQYTDTTGFAGGATNVQTGLDYVAGVSHTNTTNISNLTTTVNGVSGSYVNKDGSVVMTGSLRNNVDIIANGAGAFGFTPNMSTASGVNVGAPAKATSGAAGLHITSDDPLASQLSARVRLFTGSTAGDKRLALTAVESGSGGGGRNITLCEGGGNVGISNSNPAYKLDVAGNANLAGDVSVYGTMSVGITGSGGSYYFGGTTGRYLINDGVNFSFHGGPLIVNDPTSALETANKQYVDNRTPKISIGTTAPSSPAVNDVWIDTN